ncbi:MAG: hypothetical protein PHF05_06325 [Candidatus Izemoplasmatales bacterium]|nr:hypothetical protein [Candidatus Izemoplasmatales bacterium]
MLFNYLYNGWTNDQYEYEYSYQNLLYNKADHETTIQDLTNRIQEMNQEILMMTDIMALMADPEMEEDIKLVIEMVYDGFYAMLGEIDQEMFDFMMSMMMFNDYYVVPKEMMSVQMDAGMGMLSGMLSSLSPEKVTYLLNSLGDMMLAFEATMTLEEKTLIADMLINIMPYMIDDDSLTETMIANLVNHFLPMVFNAGDDIASFLSAMTVQKTQAIIELVTIIAISDDNDQALINLAQTLDVVFGDGSLDLQTLAGTVYELYTVMTYGANAPIDVTTENAIKGNIGNILSLAADINLMNPSALTEADFLILDEFELRLFALLEGLMTEFDNMPTDFTVVYDTQDFLDLIYDMGFDGTIEDFKTLFQVSDEEDAYYLTRALYNYMNSFISIRNFSDIQNFFAGIDQFGLTESQAIDIAIILLKDIVYEELNGLSGDEEYYQDMIDYHTVYLNEEIANMAIYEQEILDFIGSLDVSKQAISTEFWQKWKNFFQHEYEYNAYMDILYVKIDYYLLDDIENVLINMSYLDPSDPNYALDMQAYEDEYIYCLNEIDSAYHGDIDHLRYLFETRDLAYKEYIEFEATYYGTDYEYIFWEIDDMGYDSWIYSAQEYYHNAAWIQYYQFLLNNTSAYVNYELEAFMDLLNNDPDLFKGLVIILLDDMQNVTATMSADSFMEIYDFIFFMQAPHGVYPDFNAEDILALTQDISSFLKLIGNTIDLTDEASINTVISTYLGYYADKMGLTETEKDAFIAKISTVIVKYRAHADDIIDQMVLFLDALTLEEINQIIDFAHDVYSGRLNEIEMAVLGAGLFEDLFNVTGLDLTVIINAYVELRMDVENDFVFDSTTLQSEFTSFYDSTKTLIGQVAAIDLNNITTGNIASVIELVDRLQHFGMYFGNPTLILDGYSYSYDSSDFHDLLVMIFNATETEVPFIITEITTMLGLDEEQSYYKVLGIAMVLRDFENVQSLSDIARIYDGLRSMGLTNADIVKYGMSIVMGMVYPNLPADFDTQPYYDENVTLTNNIDNLDLQLDNLESVLMDEVDLLDPSIQDEVMQVWNLYMPIVDKVFDREMYINAYKYNHYYDENLFYQLLVPEYYASNWGYIHEIYDMYRLSEEEVMFYEGLYYQYHYYIVMDYDYALSVYNSFANVYYDLYDSTGTRLFSNLLESTIDSYFDLTIQKAGVVSTYNNNLDTIMQIEENGVILEVIYNYLSDPANQVVAEQVLTMLLDEFEVMKDSDSFLAMSDVLGMMQEGYMIYDLINPEFLADNVGNLSTLLGLMGSTIDFNDQIVLTGFFKEVLTTYVETKDLDPTAEAAMIAEYDNIVITYLPMLLNIPDKLSSFLATMDEAKISKVLSIIKMIDWTNYSDNGDLQRMVLVGTLIDTVFANDTLDYDYLVTQIYGLIYDVSLIEQMPIPISVDKQAEIQAIITSLDNLLVQAALVADIGIFGIDTQDIIAINDFIAVLESIFYVEQTPVY